MTRRIAEVSTFDRHRSSQRSRKGKRLQMRVAVSNMLVTGCHDVPNIHGRKGRYHDQPRSPPLADDMLHGLHVTIMISNTSWSTALLGQAEEGHGPRLATPA